MGKKVKAEPESKTLGSWYRCVKEPRLSASGSVLVLLFFILLTALSFANIENTLKSQKRYVSCIPSLTEILYALGLEDQVVGVTTNCNFPPEAGKKEKVGGVTMNLERIINLKPDLIFLQRDAQRKDIAKMQNFNLPLFLVNPHSVIEVMESIQKIGDVTGRREVADYMVKVMEDRIKKIQAKVKGKPRKKVFLVIGHRPLTTAGKNNFINDIITLAGGENVGADSSSPYPQFSFEQLLKIDPEALIILKGLVSLQEIKSDSRWNSIRAVKKNMVLFINPDIISRPTPRLVGAIEQIALFLHGR